MFHFAFIFLKSQKLVHLYFSSITILQNGKKIINWLKMPVTRILAELWNYIPHTSLGLLPATWMGKSSDIFVQRMKKQ